MGICGASRDARLAPAPTTLTPPRTPSYPREGRHPRGQPPLQASRNPARPLSPVQGDPSRVERNRARDAHAACQVGGVNELLLLFHCSLWPVHHQRRPRLHSQGEISSVQSPATLSALIGGRGGATAAAPCGGGGGGPPQGRCSAPARPFSNVPLVTSGFILLQVEAYGLKPGKSYYYKFAAGVITCAGGTQRRCCRCRSLVPPAEAWSHNAYGRGK